MSGFCRDISRVRLSTRSPVRYLAALEHEAGQGDTRDLHPDDRERRESAGTCSTEPTIRAFRPFTRFQAVIQELRRESAALQSS